MTGMKKFKDALVGKTVKAVKSLGDWGSEDQAFEVLRIETTDGGIVHLSMYSPQDYGCASFEVVTLDRDGNVILADHEQALDWQSWSG